MDTLIGTVNAGYKILHYTKFDEEGFALGLNESGNFVTWYYNSFYEEPHFNFGRYHGTDKIAAEKDFIERNRQFMQDFMNDIIAE